MVAIDISMFSQSNESTLQCKFNVCFQSFWSLLFSIKCHQMYIVAQKHTKQWEKGNIVIKNNTQLPNSFSAKVPSSQWIIECSKIIPYKWGLKKVETFYVMVLSASCEYKVACCILNYSPFSTRLLDPFWFQIGRSKTLE